MSQKLQHLAARLRACPARNTTISKKLIFDSWKSFREIDLENGDEVTPSVIAGLILFDWEKLHPLLSDLDLDQLEIIAKTALERYQQLANPPNPAGQALAGILKDIV